MAFNEWTPFYSVLLLLVSSTGKIEAQSCGGTFTANDGYLMSPNYPNIYNTSMQCTYNITILTLDTISFSFETFELDRSPGDYVSIRCKNNDNVLEQNFHWNDVTPPIVLSFCRFGQLFFSSDADRVFSTKGFRVHYQVFSLNCGDTVFNSSSGTVSSDDYPQLYGNNENCTYSIWAPESSSFTLTFEGFDLDQNCSGDWVQIRCDNSSQILPKYCGKTLPKPVYISNCNKVLIWFHTDNFNTSNGFSLQYSVSPDGCGKSNNGGLSGIITSPNFPKGYSSASCYYYIYPVSSIALAFQSFDLEPFVDFWSGDYVEIDCQSNSSYGILRYYGNTLPPLISYPLCICVRLYFYSNNALSGTGFNVKYHVNPLITNSTIINGPKNFTVNVGDRVELDCTTDAIGYYVGYPSWTLSRDGTNENTTTIATFCLINADYSSEYEGRRDGYVGSCRLVIYYAKLHHAGIYTCFDIGLASASAIVTVVDNQHDSGLLPYEILLAVVIPLAYLGVAVVFTVLIFRKTTREEGQQNMNEEMRPVEPNNDVDTQPAASTNEGIPVFAVQPEATKDNESFYEQINYGFDHL